MEIFKNGLLISPKGFGLALVVPILTIIPAFFQGKGPESYPFIALSILTLWSLLIFRFRGIEIDLINRKIRVYKTFLFFKVGKIRDLNEFPYFKVKGYKKTEAYATRGTEGSYSTKKKGIFIYDKKHKKEILLTNKLDSHGLDNLSERLKEFGLIRR